MKHSQTREKVNRHLSKPQESKPSPEQVTRGGSPYAVFSVLMLEEPRRRGKQKDGCFKKIVAGLPPIELGLPGLTSTIITLLLMRIHLHMLQVIGGQSSH